MSGLNVPEPVIPVIPLPDTPLSPSLKTYLGGIERETGRCLLFMDLARVRRVDDSIGPLVKARVRADEDKPFIAVLVDMKEVSRKRYAPAQHDPVIAHEGTHPLLETADFLLFPLVASQTRLIGRSNRSTTGWPIRSSTSTSTNVALTSLQTGWQKSGRAFLPLWRANGLASQQRAQSGWLFHLSLSGTYPPPSRGTSFAPLPIPSALRRTGMPPHSSISSEPTARR